MESDDEQDGVDVTEEFFRQTYLERQTRHGTLYGHFQRFIPEQTIIYIQYCLLRIPFLLLYDYSFTDHFNHWIASFFHYSFEMIDEEKHLIYLPISYFLDSSIFHGLIHINLNLSIPILGLILLIVLLLCSDRQLVIFYSYFTSFLVIYFNYQMHRRSEFHLNMILLQVILSYIYVQMLHLRPTVYSTLLQQRFSSFSPVIFLITRFLLPTTYGLSLLNTYYLVWALTHLSEVLIDQREKIISLIRSEFLNEIFSLYQNLGLQMVFNYLQEHIHIVTLLKIFWLTKTIVSPLGFRETFSNPYLTPNKSESLNLTSANITLNSNSTMAFNETLSSTVYFTMLYYGTETVFTLISLACLVSYVMKIISHRLFRLLHLWNEEVEQIGTVIGVMFFLLLFQSNLTRLDLHRRHVPLLKAFSLLTVALFHFLHTILEPQLLKVAMQTMTNRMAFDEVSDHQLDDNHPQEKDESHKNLSSKLKLFGKLIRSYHHRHVYTCVSILVLLVLYVVLLWRLTTFSTWLLAITAFSLELIVRLTASLAQYTIYVLDAHSLLVHVDSFDEYIFRIKAVTSCFEFILGVFLLFNGFYILFFEARGALRAFMLAIHAYLNIIKNFRRGWKILRNRRSAWDNVNQLPLATDEQINAYNDICAICHNLLTVGNTCITPCAHIFHKKCLQKAFYATQNCALCSRAIVPERTEPQQQQQQQQQQQHEHRQ